MCNNRKVLKLLPSFEYLKIKFVACTLDKSNFFLVLLKPEIDIDWKTIFVLISFYFKN